MATYITLVQYTQKGAEAIKQAPARIDAARQAAKAAGAEIKQVYLVMGHYDVVVITEAPDDETAARISLGTAMQGNVRMETLRAFTEAEFRKIVTSLP
jgi:uncharacterized protein with GYD domain